MHHESCPVATTFRSFGGLLQNLLGQRTPVILVICMPREDFFQGLVSESYYVQDARTEHPDGRNGNEDTRAARFLLTPTLHLLGTSRQVHLAFAPTLPHSRAYLSAFTVPQSIRDARTAAESATAPVLALVGSLDSHRATSDLSAQGLSRTFAVAVEAAARAGCRLRILETTKRHCPSPEGMQESGQGDDYDPWEEQVPLLNGSIRVGGDERVWSGRTVKVGHVLAQWCRVLSSGQRLQL